MTAPPDPFHLQRFIDAQAPVWPQVRAELTAGAKRSHWMWFVFPQLRGLGRSETARFYGIADLDEARAYWAHPLLGERLREACGLLAALPPTFGAEPVLGPVDALKLHSCLTLFERVAPEEVVFGALLERWYGGRRDAATLGKLGAG
ncbi:MAG: DUF1810 domain-containing protein [Burkholderiales bacterium]|nr:DUF1810 domain-containing protein [Burkholderiales bacterium]